MRLFGGLGRKEYLRVFTRWFFYSLTLLIFFMVMSGGFFKTWQPVLIIPLAMAVAMRERELSASVFGAVCGLFIDVACGYLFGFSGVWLLPCCLFASLLVSHLIKVNLINYLWVNAIACSLMALTDYFFRYVLWNVDNSVYVFTGVIIPAYLSAAVLSPFVYFLVKMLAAKFSAPEIHVISGSSADDDDGTIDN